MSSWLIEKDPLFVFEYKTSHFRNAMGCEGLSNPLRYVLADYPKRFYYIFKTEELEEWVLCICREKRLICSYCENCYTCRRFHYTKKISKLGYFVRHDRSWQPILWQVHEKYFSRNNEFQMHFDIERAFKCEFLIKKFNFLENRPKEIFIPRDIELPTKKRKIKTIKELDEQIFVK